MLKCGQKDNKKYTFGLRKEQINEEEMINNDKEYIEKCSKCGGMIRIKDVYCSSCGEKI